MYKQKKEREHGFNNNHNNKTDGQSSSAKVPYSQICKSFEEARIFVHNLSLQNVEEWIEYCNSGEKPNDIPHKPDRIYKNKGWKSYGDWLGVWKAGKSSMNTEIGSEIVKHEKYLPFEEAKNFVQLLKIRNIKEWFKYCDSGKRPKDIPYNPDRAYKNSGWKSYADWFGISKIPSGFKYRDFESARKFVKKLCLEGTREWSDYCKSGNKPDDIPYAPYTVYENDGWISMEDWLGTERQTGYSPKQKKTDAKGAALPFSKFRK